ncbi:MAG: hypothetical protein DHS20C16_04870 [Phycisphaerae bacterium]|nr:MAG: hypothetical protein DHS20C16_04870 [Phycisphaerae bacterium]
MLASAEQPVNGTGEVRSAYSQLDEILQQPLYHRWELRQQRATSEPRDYPVLKVARELMQEMTESVGRFLGKIFGKIRLPRFPNLTGGSGLLAILELLIWVGGAALIIYVLVLLYRAYLQRPEGVTNARVLSREEIRSALEQGDALALGGAAWLDEAQQLAQAGEFRAVYRALYLALLSGLHRNGQIEFRRQRTNWTYVSRFNGDENDRSVFSELTQLFDEVWYGLKGVAHRDIDELRVKVSNLVGEDSKDA